jgi:hypothetical protein
MITGETTFTLPVMAMEDFVFMRREEGARISEFDNVAWQEHPLGFFTPAHLLQKLPFDCQVPKKIYRWGWRHRIDNNTQASPYFIPVHLVVNPCQYSEASLTKKVRQMLNKARRSTVIQPLEDFDIIEREGYDVYSAAWVRTRQSIPMNKTKYLASMRRLINPSRRLILGAFIESKLAGYISAYAIDGTAYGDEVYVSQLGRKHEVNRLLLYEMTRAIGRVSDIKEFFVGQHWLEKPNITKFKLNMGFTIVQIPIQAHIQRVPQWIGSKFFPQKFYRLIGV